MYIKLTDGKPETYTISQLRRDNPNTSFPADMSVAMLEDFNVFPVTELPRPDYDPDIHYLKQSEFYEVDGQWQVHYYPEMLPEAQVAQTMRERRNALLAETDWCVALSYERELPVPQSWKTYRQELRDLTAQAGFPYQIVWPKRILLDGER